MSNSDNLIPANRRTKKEQREIARMGGIASGEARRRKKDMQEVLKDILDMPLRKGKVQNIRTLADVKGRNLTTEQAILLAQVQKALKGDTRAAAFVRDTSGNRPTERVEVQDITSAVLTDVIDDEEMP